MVELTMRKRVGRQGEIGLFVDTPIWDEEWASLKMDAEIRIEATSPRSLQQLKYAWTLAGKIADACDWMDDKMDAMEYLLIEARHYRRIYDPLRQRAYIRPKPTNFGAMDGTSYTRLLKRMKHVALTLVVPGLEESALKAEIEAMIGIDCNPAPEPQALPSSERSIAGPLGSREAGTHLAPVTPKEIA